MPRIGDVWAVPQMPLDQWRQQPQSVWYAVERGLLDGWTFKCAVAVERTNGQRSLDKPGWLTYDAAVYANEMGAPVAQLFTACALRSRTPPTPNGA